MPDLRTLIAQMDTQADRALSAIEAMEESDDEYDLIEAIESLKEAITDYQQTKGWI